MESIHSVGFGSSVWKKLKENDLKSSISSISPDESESSESELESYLETLDVDTYTRSNDRRASLLVSTVHEAGGRSISVKPVNNFLKDCSRHRPGRHSQDRPGR